MNETKFANHGILLLNKPKGKSSFFLVLVLRKKLKIQKIGHTGTLDPFATGLMVMLVGKKYTSLSEQLQNNDKEYTAELRLGVETDSYDCDGQITASSNYIPSLEEVQEALTHFQGEISQIPPMFSAKKQNGVKLYELARKGKFVERCPKQIQVKTTLLEYSYPMLKVHIECSKGTYIRSIAHDLGKKLGCGAHVSELERIRSGTFHLKDCVSPNWLQDPNMDLTPFLIHLAS